MLSSFYKCKEEPASARHLFAPELLLSFPANTELGGDTVNTFRPHHEYTSDTAYNPELPPTMSQDHELYVRDKNPSMDEIRPDPQHLLSLKLHWGLHRKNETLLFYGMIIPCWALEIAAAAMGPYLRSGSTAFIVCITLFFVLHWAAWFQTAFAMMQRSSWRRDEEAVEERVQFLWFAVRLQRMMLVCY